MNPWFKVAVKRGCYGSYYWKESYYHSRNSWNGSPGQEQIETKIQICSPLLHICLAYTVTQIIKQYLNHELQ